MRHRAVPFLAALLLFVASALAQAAEPVAESSVKAAFLYKFSGYIDWPPERFAGAQAPFVIGVMHDDEVAAALERLVPGRSVAGHPVVARRLEPGDPLSGVQLLFVGGREADRAAIRAGQQSGALVVTECPEGLEAGSAINFVVADDHVGFEVSLDAAQRTGHHISSRMLSVAKRVVQKGT
ncbi:MAG TPA: YfiR family protein [Usitatibacter sp.]|nr:YfiR family protein [Usitatibacter sp.]